MSKTPLILLINPWITDFAAYDLWAKPLGLLMLGGLLREGGCQVSLIDCLDRHDPETSGRKDLLPATYKLFHTGKYPKKPLATPEAIADIPRRYYRYGIHQDSLAKRLNELPKPDLIWVTCQMTYWYPGLQQTIAAVRQVISDVPIWLGGAYARLCPAHAKLHSGADLVVTTGLGDLPGLLLDTAGIELGNRAAWQSLAACPSPAIDLLTNPEYGPLLTSLGCPYRCPYCASSILQPEFMRRDPEAVYRDISAWHSELGIEDFAFYDDALLIDSENLKPIFERIAEDGPAVRLHTPNAIHINPLSADWCRLLKASGFETLRLGLETTQPDKQKKWGDKVDTDSFLRAVELLQTAGFSRKQIGVYLMCGLPDQSVAEVSEAIELVSRAGAQPYLCEYSPIPGTKVFERSLELSQFDLENEPLTHNNSFFACRRPDFSYDDLIALKNKVRLARRTADVI
ncbi:MAG: radical SAM protein [Deltaproteobacteria bacterium]|nr:radical SAM protein [Deltaproteobacteria bacterium]MBW1871961.1 radical SAM protein [Deltaproteobacteria bacterium]